MYGDAREWGLPAMNAARLQAIEIAEKKEGRSGQMSDVGMFRQMAREAIQAGRLPDRAPDRIWGGAGSGAQCSICGAPVGQGEFGVKLEFAGGDPGNHLVHVHCFSALEAERKEAGLAGGTVSTDKQPLSTSAASIPGGGRYQGT
jgi:hypothetical protein